jgi:release factor glutamine methyltransferase
MTRLHLGAVARELEEAGCIAARAEAEILVAEAPDAVTLRRWVGRRVQGEPLAWITGTTVFCGRTLRVAPGVYIPRSQTEEVARRAVAVLAGQGRGGHLVADLCTGAGAIAAHLLAEVPTLSVVGVDLDPRAVACAASNGVPTVRGDLDRPLRSGRFAVVTAVVPYVPTPELAFLPADVRRYEPLLALDGGSDGLDVARRVVGGAARLLEPGGSLLLELGGDQDEALEPELRAAGFADIVAWYDADGDLRGVHARRDPA